MIIMNKKLSKFEIGVFASGDLFGGGTAVIFSFFYLIFLTDVMGLQPAYAGTVGFIMSSFGLFAVPLMGFITDNTRSRFGRRRPYFLAGFFGIFASFFLMWNTIASTNQLILFVYVLFCQLFYTTINIMISVSYNAINAEISEDPKERNHATGVRMIISQVSSLICALLPLEVIKLFANPANGYRVMALVFGLFFAVPFLLMFLFNKEAVQVTTERMTFKLQEYIKPLKIRLFRNFAILNMLTFAINAIISAILAYYMKYYLNRYGEMTYILGTMLIVQTVTIPLVVKMTDLIGRPRSYRLFSTVSLAGLAVLAFVSPSSPGWLLYVTAGILGTGIGGIIVLMYTMYPDITDVGEYKTKERSAGIYNGVIAFIRTVSGALLGYAITLVIQFSGYIQPVKTIVDGMVQNIDQPQPNSVLWAFRIMICVVPFLLTVFVIFFSKKYTLSNRVLDLLRRQLKIQRGDSDGAPLSEQETAELESIVR
jgi:oligogalacturonide transporter